jgi:putative transposase
MDRSQWTVPGTGPLRRDDSAQQFGGSGRLARVTAPRLILPDGTYLITRRCTQRQFLLRPSALTNQIVEYCFAVAAEQTGVVLHAACVLSNHYHAVVSDPQACLPEFLERFHRLVAKAQNASLGRWENLWSSDKPSVVRLGSDDDIVEKMAYALANPTTAGLVKSPMQWPGLITRRLGESRTVDMPDVFFDDDGDLPHEVVIEFVRPDVFPELDDAAVNRLLFEAISRRVRQAREKMQTQGKAFLGPKRVLKLAFSASPRTPAPRRNPNPHVACRSTHIRVRMLAQLRQFRARYREAWLAWRTGDRTIHFPAGTYALRVQQGAACEPLVPT